MTDLDTLFQKLRQADIKTVDIAVMSAFRVEPYYDPRDIALSALSDADKALIMVILLAHHWDWDDYMKHTSIDFWELG